MTKQLKFDAALVVSLNVHAVELAEVVKDVKIYPQLRRTSNQASLHILFMVTTKARLPVNSQEQLESLFEPVHFPEGIEEVEIAPTLLAYDDYRRETHITFSFLENKCSTLTQAELYTLMTAVTNALQNLVNTL